MTRKPNDQGGPTRGRLNRGLILEAAVSLADRDGMNSLSMRKLGAELGVEAMSLYNHVSNKDDLIDGMVDAVFAEIELPDKGLPWKSAMLEHSRSTRNVLGRHPWATPLMDSRVNPGAATLRHHDSVIGAFRDAGFTIEMTAHAVSLLDAYTYGFAQQETSLPFDSPEETGELAEALLDQMPDGTYPYLVEMAADHVLQPGYDFGLEFEFGLNLILDGLEASRTGP